MKKPRWVGIDVSLEFPDALFARCLSGRFISSSDAHMPLGPAALAS
jgi:hypothetical protein